MKKILVLVAALGICSATAPSSQASIVVNPLLGWSSYFYWDDGLGQIDDIYDQALNLTGENTWSITLLVPSLLSISVHDDFVAGDQFGLLVAGNPIAWDTSSATGYLGTYFLASKVLALAAGTHILSIDVTTLAPNFIDGAGWIDISSARPQGPNVPDGGLTLGLLGLAMAGISGLRKKFAN